MDSLDSPDFDPIAYINQKFPTESSLDGLDSFSATVNAQIYYLDEELSHAIQTQSVSGKQATQDISDAQEAIVELVEKIADIKQQAIQSEKMVQEICADIKRLDCAKSHLQSTITSLKRLQMLLAAVNQLEGLVNDLQYKDTANLLDAVKQLMTHFQSYTAIPVVSELQARVTKIQSQLEKHIRRTFRDIGQLVDSTTDAESFASELPGNMSSLSEACLVVDALGLEARKDVLDDFIGVQLNPYEKIFGIGMKHISLEHTDRRWSWFKRLYKHIDSKFSGIFPVHWNVLFRLSLEFVKKTHSHMLHALTIDSSNANSDVQVLIQAVQSTLKFESDLTSKWEEVLKSQPQLQSSSQITQSNAKQPKSPMRRTSIIDTVHNNINSSLGDSNSKTCDVPINISLISNCISCEFDRFLGPYVMVERQSLEEMLRRLSSDEDSTRESETNSGSAPVYGSAKSMFAFIKGSIKRCTAITNGQTFLSLCKEFRTCLQQYCESLQARCVAPIMSNGVAVYKLPPGMEIILCYLINTAEYCAEVVPQLESLIKSKMKVEYAEKVDLNMEGEMFQDLVAIIMKALVGGVVDKLDPSFKDMMNKNWAGMTEAGEDSTYVQAIQKVLVEVVPKLRTNLSGSYFKSITSKISSEIMQRFLDTITKQKKISDPASQQLLLDTHILKTTLLQLPVLGLEGESDTNLTQGMYARLVITRTGQIEAILKLVATPEDMLAERFHILWPAGLAADLIMVMNLKGINRRQDQQKILDALGSSFSSNATPGAADLLSPNSAGSKDNFLSSVSVPQALTSGLSAASSSSASMMSSSIKLLSTDFGFTSTARSAVGNLKWNTASNK